MVVKRMCVDSSWPVRAGLPGWSVGCGRPLPMRGGNIYQGQAAHGCRTVCHWHVLAVAS